MKGVSIKKKMKDVIIRSSSSFALKNEWELGKFTFVDL